MIDARVLCSCIIRCMLIIRIHAAVRELPIAIGLVPALERPKIIFIEHVNGIANSYVRNVELVVDLLADRYIAEYMPNP